LPVEKHFHAEAKRPTRPVIGIVLTLLAKPQLLLKQLLLQQPSLSHLLRHPVLQPPFN
jgi:hypothetical protein